MIDDYQHELLIFALAITMDAKNILETGVREGTVTQALLKAAKVTQAKVTSVDIENRSYLNYPDWNFVQSESIQFLENCKEVYDLIYIDDWHEYNHVKKQLELIDKLTTNSSIVLLHDTMYNKVPIYNTTRATVAEFANGGPARAVLELDKTKWEWCTIPTNHGLTILRKL